MDKGREIEVDVYAVSVNLETITKHAARSGPS